MCEPVGIPVVLAPSHAQPAFQEPQRIVPEGVDLHRLAPPRRDDPIADLGVHPGKLVSLFALAQQPVAGIDADAKPRTREVGIGDLEQTRQEDRQTLAVVGPLHVAIKRVKKPERGVRRMVQAIGSAFRKHVGNQPVADVVCESAQDEPGLGGPTGRQGQALEADHRVAAPVGEPVITGDHRADLLAGRVGPGSILHATCRH